jgi:hypothetical protein
MREALDSLHYWGANNVWELIRISGPGEIEGPHTGVTKCIHNQCVFVSDTAEHFCNIVHTTVQVIKSIVVQSLMIQNSLPKTGV